MGHLWSSDRRPQAIAVVPASTPEARAVALQRLAHAAADLVDAAKAVQAAAAVLGEEWLREHPPITVRMSRMLGDAMSLETHVQWAVEESR